MTKIDCLKCEICGKVFIFQFGSLRNNNWMKYHADWLVFEVLPHVLAHENWNKEVFDKWIKNK